MPADPLGPLVIVVDGRVYSTRTVTRVQAQAQDTARERLERWT
jgi:hypothetical protein